MKKYIIFLLFVIGVCCGQTKKSVAVLNIEENNYGLHKAGRPVAHVKDAYVINLETELFNTGVFTVISQDVLEKFVTEMKMDDDGFTIEDYKSIGNQTSVDYVITGLITTSSQTIKMIDIKSGEIIKIVNFKSNYSKVSYTKYVAEMLAFDKSNILDEIRKKNVKQEKENLKYPVYICCAIAIVVVMLE